MSNPQSLRILIVEDDPLFSEIAAGLVRPILDAFPESVVVSVQTAEAALKAISEIPTPDVTLLDLTLPPFGVEETLRHLSTLEEKTAVVILTGHKEEFVRQFIGQRDTPIIEKTKAMANPGILTLAICAAVERYQGRKWAAYQRNLAVMKSLCHAPAS